MNRRAVLSTVGIGLGSLAGCIAGGGQSDTESPEQSETESTESIDEQTETTSSITDQERSTDCKGEHDSMHDSVIQIEDVTTSLGDDYIPIQFADLPSEEKKILRAVTEEGGYETCDPSDAFSQFLDRVDEHLDQQDADREIYLEREGTYYGLYVEFSDLVYAY